MANDGSTRSTSAVCCTSSTRTRETEPFVCRMTASLGPRAMFGLKRYREQGVAGIEEHSRRPQHSPRQTAAPVEQRIVDLRRSRPDWGARKLHHLLRDEGILLPVITLHRILLRHGLCARTIVASRLATLRTRSPEPALADGLQKSEGMPAAGGTASVIDDHSRFVIALEKTGSTRTEAVQERLEHAFRTDGLPEAMLMDHGTPWWNVQAPSGWTKLQVWLMKQGIACLFSGIRHPQTKARSNASTSRWRWRAAADYRTSRWMRNGATSFATSTTISARTRPSACKPPPRAGSESAPL